MAPILFEVDLVRKFSKFVLEYFPNSIAPQTISSCKNICSNLENFKQHS